MNRLPAHRNASYRGAERRRHKRHPMPCPVRLSLPGAAEAAGKTADVSDGGILIALPRQLLPACGSLVDVLLRVPRSTPNTYMLEDFTAQARVVRHITSSAGDPIAAGLQFVQPLALALEV